MKYKSMNASHTKEAGNKDERIVRQICYLTQAADFPIEVDDVLQEALELLAEFPAFEPKLLGLQLSSKAPKQTVLGLVGSAHYYIGTQIQHLALTVLFSPLVSSKRHFQLICNQKFLSFHLIDHTGRVILDTCPHVGLLDTVRWLVSAVENFLVINASAATAQSSDRSSDRISMIDIWTPTEFYRGLCHEANQMYNTLTAELAERQRVVVEEINTVRHQGSIISSTATRLAKDMSVALELISNCRNNTDTHGKPETVANNRTSTNVAQRIQSNTNQESNVRALETTRIVANLSAIDRTILDITDLPPTQSIPMVTPTMLRSVRDALGDLTEKALNLRYTVHSINQDVSPEG